MGRVEEMAELGEEVAVDVSSGGVMKGLSRGVEEVRERMEVIAMMGVAGRQKQEEGSEEWRAEQEEVERAIGRMWKRE